MLSYASCWDGSTGNFCFYKDPHLIVVTHGELSLLRPTFFMFIDDLTPVMFTFAKTLLEMLVWATTV